jgi:hypothetical protein
MTLGRLQECPQSAQSRAQTPSGDPDCVTTRGLEHSGQPPPLGEG